MSTKQVVIPPPKQTIVDNKNWLKLPEGSEPEIAQSGYGPCSVDSKHYAVVMTNMIGEIQVHPCGSCKSPFLFSPIYGWVHVRDKSLRARIQQIVEQAKAEGVFPARTIFYA